MDEENVSTFVYLFVSLWLLVSFTFTHNLLILLSAPIADAIFFSFPLFFFLFLYMQQIQ